MQHSLSMHIGQRIGFVSKYMTLYRQFMNVFYVGQIVGAQFTTKKLQNYASDLTTQKNEFQVAMLLQIAIDVDKKLIMRVVHFVQLSGFKSGGQPRITYNGILDQRSSFL